MIQILEEDKLSVLDPGQTSEATILEDMSKDAARPCFPQDSSSSLHGPNHVTRTVLFQILFFAPSSEN